MPSTTLTASVDSDTFLALEKIAKYEDLSLSDMTNQALGAFIAERVATRKLLERGLQLIDAGSEGISAAAVHEWFLAEPGTPFPRSGS